MLKDAMYIILTGRGDQTSAYSEREMKETVERMQKLPLTSRQKEDPNIQTQPVHVFKRCDPDPYNL